MGEPGDLKSHHAICEQTQGTETSEYLEEEKERSIPKVVASEMGRAQTVVVTATAGL